MPINVDTEALALADQLIFEYDLISIRRDNIGGPINRSELRIALGAAISAFSRKQSNEAVIDLTRALGLRVSRVSTESGRLERSKP